MKSETKIIYYILYLKRVYYFYDLYAFSQTRAFVILT